MSDTADRVRYWDAYPYGYISVSETDYVRRRHGGYRRWIAVECRNCGYTDWYGCIADTATAIRQHLEDVHDATEFTHAETTRRGGVVGTWIGGSQ